jgi:hypothetical protein
LVEIVGGLYGEIEVGAIDSAFERGLGGTGGGRIQRCRPNAKGKRQVNVVKAHEEFQFRWLMSARDVTDTCPDGQRFIGN